MKLKESDKTRNWGRVVKQERERERSRRYREWFIGREGTWDGNPLTNWTATNIFFLSSSNKSLSRRFSSNTNGQDDIKREKK